MDFAVEFAHDENILRKESCASYLNQLLSLLSLDSQIDDDDDDDDDEDSKETICLRQRLMFYKTEIDALDKASSDYYVKKEKLIFKVVCEIKGYDYDQYLTDNQLYNEAMEQCLEEESNFCEEQ
ncbi:uncharacterized protein Dwil_GK18443 [Drosophila willistoni]|uniref:Uncharacterized protein n=1 Tax=Drosophila willistoni TaxID=7260 RepID=B4NLP0_DROWI|nr:uncharacterized protein LOC6651749 [Drosophila willistoni]EDW85279.1 uncharacterized protein Dwil_GK18443 [Drosophila willistoni]